MSAPETLMKTPLTELHLRLGGKMVPFAGYEMPVQFPEGVMKEHLHTRAAAGLFDVSHMGQIRLRPRSGRMEDAALALERLMPVDALALKPGRQRYGLLTNEAGGIRDDLMFAHRGDHFFIVVNAACKAQDLAHIRDNLAGDCEVEDWSDRALIALQGPQAEAALARLAPAVAAMAFMDVADVTLIGADCVVSRSGYTGEDGYEISVPAGRAVELAEALLADSRVHPIGLGARDSLRLEAGLCLYGSDIDGTTTPVEAALEWAMQKSRRTGGARAGGFPGAGVILQQMAEGAARRRVGLLPEGRAPVRAGVQLFDSGASTGAVGRVTSGGFGPTIGGPVAMGYVPTRQAADGAQLFADLRGSRVALRVAKTPFIAPGYKRG
ncbi:MAG: glycine cleavage system aminomethyltransferase GcvT [Methylobacteriaceae bacterium]|nr:glycine cleavage system aminomethyltransferase GcvT [Methylobacteriaceae bacterium]